MRTKVFHKTDYADKKGLNVGQKRFLKTTLNLRPIGRLPSPLKQLDWSENNAQWKILFGHEGLNGFQPCFADELEKNDDVSGICDHCPKLTLGQILLGALSYWNTCVRRAQNKFSELSSTSNNWRAKKFEVTVAKGRLAQHSILSQLLTWYCWLVLIKDDHDWLRDNPLGHTRCTHSQPNSQIGK